jgi:hypothetical protein
MRQKQKIINLFKDKDISSIKHVISINCEEDLNLFWDFTTNSNNVSYEFVHTFVYQFYNFAISYIRETSSEFFDIILEESDKYFYFTLWNKNITLSFKNYIEKTSVTFLCSNNRITAKLDKSKYLKKIQEINHKQHKYNLADSNQKKQKPYTFLDKEDFIELVNLNDNMQDIIYYIRQFEFNNKNFISLRSSISLFCFTLRYYKEIFPMAGTLTDFSNLLNTRARAFKKIDKDGLKLVSDFIQNIDTWLYSIFVNGDKDLYFMDKSMKDDYLTIKQIISTSK